jgi:hypothetical protein
MIGRACSAPDARVIRFPRPARARSMDRLERREAMVRSRNRPKPPWHVLYSMVAVSILLFVVADVESPTDGWRILAECLGTGLIIGLMALWVRANRTALAVARDAPHGGETLRSYVAYSPLPSSQRQLDFSENEPSQSSLVRTGPAEEEDAKCFAKSSRL